MNIVSAFIELDKLYESFNDRQELIRKLKSLGKDYYFDNYSDKQLFRMLERAEKEKQIQDVDREQAYCKNSGHLCAECGSSLTDGGFCPSCDDGYEDFYECLKEAGSSTELSNEHAVVSPVDRIKEVYESGYFSRLPVGRDNALTVDIFGPDKERLVVYFKKQPEFNYEINTDSGIVSHEFISDKYDVEIFDGFVSMYKIPQNESLNEWKAQTSAPNNSISNNVNQAQQSQAQASNIVTIVYDYTKHKLRAQADDGIHGVGNVAFPNKLRTSAGQQYEVDDLIWNGKNYRVSGNIVPINGSNIDNLNENINKENYEMNFQTILEELDRIYEEDTLVADRALDDKKAVFETLVEADADAADAEILVDDEPIVDDDQAAAEEQKLVLECINCGGILIKDEADVDTDDEDGIVNVDDTCTYCDEAKGYKVIGSFVPYEDTVEESLTEGKIKDSLKKVATRLGADAATCIRALTELIPGDNAVYDFAEYVENKATLKALQSGNDKVLNSLTKEDIEELKQDIEAYKNRKTAADEDDLEEGLFDSKETKAIKNMVAKKTGNFTRVFVTFEAEIGSKEAEVIEKLLDAKYDSFSREEIGNKYKFVATDVKNSYKIDSYAVVKFNGGKEEVVATDLTEREMLERFGNELNRKANTGYAVPMKYLDKSLKN